MNIVVEKQPRCVATLRVEIPAETVKGQRDKIVSAYAGKARIPGFRPGKAPRSIVEKRFQKEIAEELNERLVNDAFDEALKQENLKVLDFGMPQDLKTLPEGGLSFESQLTLAPDVELPQYKGLTVTVPPLAVPEEEVDAKLQSLREQLADFKDITDRPAQTGDVAVIDYSSTVDGQPTEEFLGRPAGHLRGRENFWLKLDEASFLPGFAEQLTGMTTGESRVVTINPPADFPIVELQGRPVTFDVTLKELKESILPELNDEFVSRFLPDKSLDELRQVIRENLQAERSRKIEDMKVNQIVAHFNSQVDFELPENLVTRETQSQADAMVRRGVQAGMSEDDIESQQEEIFATAGNQAIHNLRTNFILQEIARAENITVSDRELINHLAQVAQSRKLPVKKFIRDMQRAGRLDSVRGSIAIGKTIDFLVEHAEVVESPETAVVED